MKKSALFLFLIAIFSVAFAQTPEVISVGSTRGDATAMLRRAVEKAAKRNCRPVEIRLTPGAVYNISRTSATPLRRHISNTTSAEENVDPTKHVGILLRGLRNVTINGNGATIVTHGEMTPWAIDSCGNIAIRDLTVRAADPTVPEMTVTGISDGTPDSLAWLTVAVNPLSRYEIRDGRLWWIGEGWEFTNGIAQLYDPETGTTARCRSIITDGCRAEELSPGRLRLYPGFRPDVRVGMTYQMRHSYRYEAGGFINRSRDVRLERLTLHSVANFGIVGQFSENLTYSDVACVPDTAAGRTNAGYADFFHFSGCRGKLTVERCRFRGSQDDDINVHGTHLKLTGVDPGGRKIRVRFMHGQTYGFEAFAAGDSVAFNNSATLLTLGRERVAGARMLDDYEMELTLDNPVGDGIVDAMNGDGVVAENISWYPEVEIRGCRFECMPTRAVLVTTPRRVVIEDNDFIRVPMPSVLIADDARSWYESGAVRDVTIRGNRFIQCAGPVICVAPEVKRFEGTVHQGITVEDNAFTGCTGAQLKASATRNIVFRRNSLPAFTLDLSDTAGVLVEN